MKKANFLKLKQGLLTFAACALLTFPAEARDIDGKLEVNGKVREYLLHIPTRLPAGNVPLVMMLHGGGGGPQSIVRSSDMSDKADKEGFIAVYPAGVDSAPGPIKGTWNADGCCAGAMRNNEQDILFISKLIDYLTQQYAVDPKRVYIGGMSNGAMMSERATAVLGNKIAAAGFVSGAIFETQPKAVANVPVIIFHGLKDDMVPYNGGTSPNKLVASSQSLPFKPTLESFNYWSQQNGCTGPVANTDAKDYTVKTATNCKRNADVVFYTMKNGGHEWPQTISTKGLIRGPSTPASINATDVMWNFFKTHRKL